MIKLEDINRDISFNEPTHVYKNKKGEILTSVSQLIGFFKNKFDEHGHIARACSKRDGIPVKEVLQKWEQTKIDGMARGTSFHRQVEHFIKHGVILDESDKDIVEQFSKIKFEGKLHSEIRISSRKHLLAGTVDLISLKDNNHYDLSDFKTNKTLQKKNKYKNMMLYPLEHLDDTSWQHYIIQLNLYAHILAEYGYICDSIKIHYINPETRLIEEHIVPEAKKDVQILLKHFKKMMDW